MINNNNFGKFLDILVHCIDFDRKIDIRKQQNLLQDKLLIQLDDIRIGELHGFSRQYADLFLKMNKYNLNYKLLEKNNFNEFCSNSIQENLKKDEFYELFRILMILSPGDFHYIYDEFIECCYYYLINKKSPTNKKKFQDIFYKGLLGAVNERDKSLSYEDFLLYIQDKEYFEFCFDCKQENQNVIRVSAVNRMHEEVPEFITIKKELSIPFEKYQLLKETKTSNSNNTKVL